MPVEIEYHWHNVYVIKRPGVDNFLKKMGEIYEVVVFTASLSKASLFLDSRLRQLIQPSYSTQTQFWTNSIFIVSSLIDYSGRVVTTTRVIMSRYVPSSLIVDAFQVLYRTFRN